MPSVFHFSEDPTIRRFVPHVPGSNPSHPPAVCAIDAEHAPLYWFPRSCPRTSVWARTDADRERLRELFGSEATRICATEGRWLNTMRTTVVYRYTFDPADFQPSMEGDGQYVSLRAVEPVAVEPLDDLIGLHVEAGVELRFTPRLGALTDQILASGLPFSFVRLRQALV